VVYVGHLTSQSHHLRFEGGPARRPAQIRGRLVEFVEDHLMIPLVVWSEVAFDHDFIDVVFQGISRSIKNVLEF